MTRYVIEHPDGRQVIPVKLFLDSNEEPTEDIARAASVVCEAAGITWQVYEPIVYSVH